MSIDPSLTVAELLALVRLAQSAGLKRNLAELPAIERADRSGRLPLSYAQQRPWFLEQMGGLGSTYHIPGRLHLPGELDREARVRALDRLMERHEVLRTPFPAQSGEPEQRIGPETSRFPLVEHDLEGEAADALERLVGGHSLLVVRLVEQMRQRGLHAPVRALFVAPTLAELAAEVGEEAHGVEVPANRIPAPGPAARDAADEVEFVL